MKHIRQRFKNDCGIAVAATVTGLPYSKIRSIKNVNHEPSGITTANMQSILNRASEKEWLHKEYSKPISIQHYKPKKQRMVLGITKPNNPKGHYISTDGTYYYDPDEIFPVPVNKARTLPYWKIWFIEEEFICS